MTVRPAKTQISLNIHPVWSESSLCTQWVAKDPNFLHAVSKDSDQTGQMPRLISVFAGHTCHFVGFVMRRLKFESFLNTELNARFRSILWCRVESIIWARSCEKCLMSYANNKGADQLAHPRSLIRTFVVRCLDSMICILAISKVSRF